MTKRDEELQHHIEAGNIPSGDDPDMRAYGEVFSRLKKAPEVALSPDFADAVMVKILKRQSRHSSRDFLWFGIGIFLLTVACLVAVAMSGLSFAAIRHTSGYSGLLLFGMLFILVLNRIDRKLVSGKHEGKNAELS